MLCTRGATLPKGRGGDHLCWAPSGCPLPGRVSLSKPVEQAKHRVGGGGGGRCVVLKALTPNTGGGGGAKAALPVSWSPTGGQPTACTLALWWKFGPTECSVMGWKTTSLQLDSVMKADAEFSPEGIGGRGLLSKKSTHWLPRTAAHQCPPHTSRRNYYVLWKNSERTNVALLAPVGPPRTHTKKMKKHMHMLDCTAVKSVELDYWGAFGGRVLLLQPSLLQRCHYVAKWLWNHTFHKS